MSRCAIFSRWVMLAVCPLLFAVAWLVERAACCPAAEDRPADLLWDLRYQSPNVPLAQAAEPAKADGATLDAATRTAVIERVLAKLNELYVFPDVAKKMEAAIRDRMAKKEYDSPSGNLVFAQSLTTHLREVCHDKHLSVRYTVERTPKGGGSREPTLEMREAMRRRMAARNFAFEKVEWLDGNIGYLSLLNFVDPEFAGDTAAGAMAFLANTDALIIDLRRNGGGSPAMVALLCSYLFAERPVHLNDLYNRETNTTRQWWTLPYLPGKRYLGKEVYVLTSKRTFSAAEEFTYNLKNLKRATIVGETTGGGAHPVAGHPVHDHFVVVVPVSRAINPITKTNWEGTGVKPDVEVPQEIALKTAHLAALKNLREKAKDKQQIEELDRLIRAKTDELKETKG